VLIIASEGNMRDDEQSDHSDSDLDRVIREALAVSIDPRRVARLERYWNAQSRKQALRRRVMYVLPVAAAAFVLVALLLIMKDREDRSPIARGAKQTESPQGIADEEPHAGAVIAGREPTAYERVMFMARAGKVAPNDSKPVAEIIDELVRQLPLDVNADAGAAIQAAGISAPQAESVLLRRLSRSSGAEREAILQLIAACGTSRSIPAVLRSVRQGASQERVVRVIEQIDGVGGLVRVAKQTADAKLRDAIVLRLLQFDSSDAKTAYLMLVHDGTTREVALTAVDSLAEPPVQALLDSLDRDDQWARVASATVLAHVNGPEVTQALIDRVLKKPSDTTEAWIALMACRGEVAADFLSYAATTPQLLGHMNSARVRWEQMVH
jgi:hypothetical protein